MISKSLQLKKFAIALSVCGFSLANQVHAQYAVFANELISNTADFKNPIRVTDADQTNYALKTLDGASASASNIRVRFPDWGKAGDVVNVVVRGDGGLLSAGVLNRIAVKLYDSAGVTPVAEFSGSSLLSLSLLAPYDNIYSIKFITNPASSYKFKDAMVELDNTLSVSLSDFRVYNFNFQRPCPPVLANTVTKSGTSGFLSLASVDNAGRVADADPDNYATMNTTLSVLGIGSAYIEVAYPKNAKAGDFVGFTIANEAGLLDLDILGGLTLVTYDEAGKVKETLTGSSSLSLNLLSGTTNRYALGFMTKDGSYEISKVRILKTATLGLLSSIRVYNSFFYTLNRPPVTITSSGPTTFCDGGSVVLTAFDSLGSTDFVWNNGSTGASISVAAAGTYYVQSVDAASCERRSIPISVVVNEKPLQPKVVLKASSLEIDNDFVYYQWYKNGVPVFGALTHVYTPADAGKYYVLVTDANGCVNNSDTFTYAVTTGINQLAAQNNISLYPNPAQDIVNIKAPFAVTVQVSDIMGKVVLQQEKATQIDMQSLPAGTYIFKLTDAQGSYIRSERINKTDK